MTPIISVIIPVGADHAKYLPQAVKSVHGNTWGKLAQVVVVNDTGKNLTIGGVRLLETKGLQGSSIARNLAIEQTRTPFIIFLDADDILVNTAIETMVLAYATYKDASYIFGDAWTTDGKNDSYYDAPQYDRKLLLGMDGRLISNIHNVTTLIPTEMVKSVGGFDEVIRSWEDYDFYIRLGIAGYCGTKVPSPFILYRLHTGVNRAFGGKIGNELIREVRERYADYISEKRSMMGCCGSNAEAQQMAQQALGQMPPTNSEGDVLMEYLGEQTGSIPFRVNGRTYKGANTPGEKFLRVKREDANQLLGIGIFRLVPESALRAGEKPNAEVVQARKRDAEQGVTIPRGEKAQELAATVTIVGCANPKCGHITQFHAPTCQALVGESICGCEGFVSPLMKEHVNESVIKRRTRRRRNAEGVLV